MNWIDFFELSCWGIIVIVMWEYFKYITRKD